MMREVLERRFKRLLTQQAAAEPERPADTEKDATPCRSGRTS